MRSSSASSTKWFHKKFLFLSDWKRTLSGWDLKIPRKSWDSTIWSLTVRLIFFFCTFDNRP